MTTSQNLRRILALSIASLVSSAYAQTTFSVNPFINYGFLPAASDVVYAVDIGGPGAITANGINFAADDGTFATYGGLTYDGFLSTGSTGDSGFDSALTSAKWGSDGVLTLNNLIAGQTYTLTV